MHVVPYRNKVIRPLKLPSADERWRWLEEVGYNVARLPSEAVFIDLLTDSGQAALSDRQCAAMMRGDEAYAGSRSFLDLQETVERLFNLPFTIPAHQGRAAENLLVQLLLDPVTTVLCNPVYGTTRRLIAHAGAYMMDVSAPTAWRLETPTPFKGDIDLEALDQAPRTSRAVLWLSATAAPVGGQPISMANLRAASAWARERGIPVVLDASRLHENAWFVHRYEPGFEQLSPATIARRMAACCDYLYLSGKKVGLSTVGGLVATSDQVAAERLRNLCVIFEGMPFYGGMAGRDMGALAVGLNEAFDPCALEHRANAISGLAERLRSSGVPLVEPTGGHGIFLDSARFAPGLGETASASLLSWLYAIGGVRGAAVDIVDTAGLTRPMVRLALPWRAFDHSQLDWVAEAAIALYEQRDRLTPLVRDGSFPAFPGPDPRFTVADPPRLRGLDLDGWTRPLAPYRSKMVELAPNADGARRQAALKAAGYNMYLMPADEIEVDLFTDSGTNAMSDDAWARMARADEAYRGASSYERFAATVRDVYGYAYVLPAHQGRGAEALLSEAMVSRERPIVIGNQSFITTLGHIVRCGGQFVDVTVEAASRMHEDHPFKGDVDLVKLEAAIEEHGAERVAYLNVGVTLNSSGGQPVRLGNLRAVRDLATRYGLPVYLDATRAVENAWFVQQREPGHEHRGLGDLLRELCSCADGVTVSGKKDLLVNIGGFLATNDVTVAERAARVSERVEGLPTSGGLANRDLEAMIQGLSEMREPSYITHRMRQTLELGARLKAAGISIVEPVGGHAVFIDAEAFLPHLSRRDHPGHALAAALYLESGVRAMMVRGTFEVDGKYRGVDLLRLAVPRRVYGPEHFDRVVDSLVALHARAGTIAGLAIESEPVAMRATLSRYRPKGLTP